MSELRTHLAKARLYLVTDARRAEGDLLELVDAALAGGVDIVQLRNKEAKGILPVTEELALLAQIRELCTKHDALLAVNDRADIAHFARADVLHIGQTDLTPTQAREIVGTDMLIGRSTHNVDQARAASVDPLIDYFCVGPLWETPTKPGRAAVGLDFVREVAGWETTKPWFTIGGIDNQRVTEATAAGSDRIVVVRAITDAADRTLAARELRAHLPH
jgi:thiamine-phosphate pyrophosphorylase